MPPFVITINADELVLAAEALLLSRDAMIAELQSGIKDHLGPRGVYLMREAIEPHRYTGALSDSIKFEQPNPMAVEIHPTAVRGDNNPRPAGRTLELGRLGPIPDLPLAPIAAWAGQRLGLTDPDRIKAVWLKIRHKGVEPHPFLDYVFMEIQQDIWIVESFAADAFMTRAAQP